MRLFLRLNYSRIFVCAYKHVREAKVNYHWIAKAISWADVHFDHLAYYRHNEISYPYGGFRELLAIGSKRIIHGDSISFDALAKTAREQWLFGYLGYDLKNELHRLTSSNQDHLGFPDLYFFEPEYLIEIIDNKAHVICGDEKVLELINAHTFVQRNSVFRQAKPEFDKSTYVKTVEQLIEHIIAGDFYEINFCQGFYGDFENAALVSLYLRLNELSPKPFSCLQKLDGHAIICASPERFLKKEGRKLISQPIKGTRPRGLDPVEDERLKVELRNDEKELAENMMIVDLVRNDLARSAKAGSVKVEEMFGIYSFEHVHQMISTITAEMKADISACDAIRYAFPMGSMTGAPKRKVMELTDVYERSKRGAFSGAAGYFSPDENFDFNVLIRSLFLDLKSKQYGFHVGSAITYDAKAENEYEECFIKAKALLALINE